MLREKWFLDFYKNNFVRSETIYKSDYFSPPKISENSVFVY